MTIIDPIGAHLQGQVVAATATYIDKARSLFDADFNIIPVQFDLKGKAAGMYRVQNSESVIRYNPYLFAKYFDDSLAVTVPHEVAHYITDRLYGLRKIRPHGKEWKTVMGKFGVDASRTCHYDMEGIPTRVFKRFPYGCGCTQHTLTARLHNQITQGKKHYFCRQCGSVLVSK